MVVIKGTACRSRFALFISSVDSRKNGKGQRCTEPSRLPVKQMKRFLKKRSLRNRIRNYVSKNVPKSSKLYQIIREPFLCKTVVFGNGERITEVNETRMTKKYTLRNRCKMLSLENEMVYKSLNHKINNIANKLSGDIETNPGPFVVDPSKTIHAPYSQGNSFVFGSNAGKQCVAMSLIATLFDFIYSIRSATDLKEIMTVGNELYTCLSQSAGQDLLMLTELPDVLCLRDTMYRLKYSDSYFGNVRNFNDCTIEAHCLPLIEAFELLLRDNFTSFILTITTCTVAILVKSSGTFKVFDSHSRDSEGMFDSCGTCVLVEIASLDKLVEYFEKLYVGITDAVYEIRGVQISTDVTGSVDLTTPKFSPPVNIENLNRNELIGDSSSESDTLFCSCTRCCFICFYAICFSILKEIRYWNETTLDAIIENSNQLHENMMLKEHCTVSDLPTSLAIDVANIEARFNVVYKGKKEQESLFVVQEMKKVVTENQEHNTGFLMSMSQSKCYVCCIFKRGNAGRTSYAVFGLDNKEFKGYVYEIIESVTSAIEVLVRMLRDKERLEVKTYEMQFIKCSCDLLEKDRQKIIRRYVSVKQKQKLAKQRRENYAAMEPAKKRACLDKCAAKYASMESCEKKALTIRKAEKYRLMEPIKKQELRVQNAEKYRLMEPTKKQELRVQNAKKYRLMDPNKKQELSVENAEKYRVMEPNKKQKFFLQNAEKYRIMDSSEKKDLLKQIVTRRKEKCSTTHSLDYYIQQFNRDIREGPYYICVVCNRLLYRKTVLEFKRDNYNSSSCLFTSVTSFNGKMYICNTCHITIKKKNKTPCQAVYNNLAVDDVPPELASLDKLEQILVSQRIVFQKIVVMPKGQQRKIRGAICNVPVSCEETCHVLPRPPDSSGIIMLKLKRRLQFRGHVYFQAVRPEVVLHALQWLQRNNKLYQNVSINLENIDRELSSLCDHERETESDIASCSQTGSLAGYCDGNDGDRGKKQGVNEQLEKDKGHCSRDGNLESDASRDYDDDCEREDPLNEHRAATCETCLQSIMPDYPIISDEEGRERSAGNEIFSVAPGENKHPVSMMTDRHCEELAFPVLFPKGRFGYKMDRKEKLTPVRYFNARLLHYSGRFAMNPEYLFFAQFIIEQKKVSDSINIALKKLQGQPLTASQFRSNEQCVKNLIFKDQAYLFLRGIPGSPPYWQKFMYEVIAMVQQLGIPTWFLTLSCADLRWHELFHILSRVRGENITDEEIDNLSYNEKCSLLNLNPVIVAKHFQHRVETFFKDVLLSNAKPIGKIVYYALRIEFQMRGSPHLHSLIWTSDCPELKDGSEEAYIRYIDEHVQASLPNRENDCEFHELVSMYQKHTHSRSCKKYRNIPCRFNFGQFFTNETIVSKPLADDMPDEQKVVVLKKRNEILCSVKEKINEKLDPSKPDYDSSTRAEDVLAMCKVSKHEYNWALSISADSDFELHLKRTVDSCFINNYFEAGIKGFRANVDLQPVFNHYKCITYVCSYFSKDETECSQAIMNAAREAKDNNLNIRESLKKVGTAFLSCREVSAQECVYRCMPELWLRKTFPCTVFVNTGLPEERCRVAKSQEEIEALDDDSTDIFMSNIIERYSDRPNIVDQLCLAEFAAYYYKDYAKNPDEFNDVQPNVLSDDLVESNHVSNCESVFPPLTIKLNNGQETMKRRKIKAVIRFHTPSKSKEPEKFYHHLLMLYFPWRKETDLLGDDQLYSTKFQEPEVFSKVEINRKTFEPNAEAIDSALQMVSENRVRDLESYDPINDQENDDLSREAMNSLDDEGDDDLREEVVSLAPETSQTFPGIATYNQPSAIRDEELRDAVRSLNVKQRITYDVVLTWCRNSIKSVNCLTKETIKPIHIFVTGGGGGGKSHLIRTIYHTAVNMFKYSAVNPSLPTVLLMAPTGVAAVNISGTTVNTGLAIPKHAGINLPPLPDQKKTLLRLSLSELKLLIIDEISMVSNNRLLHIHQRLKEIFGTSNSKIFAGISIIAVGDLHQLPPIQQKPIFCRYSNDVHNLSHPWHEFKMIELVEIMRQKDDQSFIELLNRLRVAQHTEADIRTIQSRAVDVNDKNNYPLNELHVWAENKPVIDYNNERLQEILTPLHVLQAVDQYPKNVSRHEIERVLSKGRSYTGGLDLEVSIKQGARVMLTNNVDISDRLINGQLGTVARILVNEVTQKPTIVYIKFDDEDAGNLVINKSADIFAIENKVVPIKPILAKIKLNPGKRSSPEIDRLQFPLALAWACTVHKVQGLTLNKIVISFELFKQRSFNYGQAYVALSRATSLQGLYVLGKLEHKHIKADPRVIEEYERLRNTSLLEENANFQVQEDDPTIPIVLLNIRSLRKHSIDIKFDRKIFNCDMLLLTETQLTPYDSDNDIKDHLYPFILNRQDSNDRYSSLAFCTKTTVCIKEKEYFPVINGLMFTTVFTSRKNCQMRFLFLYRKQASNVHDFVNNLNHIINWYTIDVILGDFNINYFDEKESHNLKNILENTLGYQQIVSKPTFLSGSLLDHVYIRSNKFKSVYNAVIGVYYSDHDAVKILFHL